MKKALIGGFLSLIGSIWALAIVFIISNNLVSSWRTPPGRFLATAIEMDLIFLFILAVALVLFGVIILACELFRREK